MKLAEGSSVTAVFKKGKVELNSWQQDESGNQYDWKKYKELSPFAVVRYPYKEEVHEIPAFFLTDVASLNKHLNEKEKKKVAEEKTPYWKIYLSGENKVRQVEYGSDRSHVEIIGSNGKVQRREELAEQGGFAGKLANAVGKTESGNMLISPEKMEEVMLDNGLYYLEEKNSWIRKEDYFSEKIAKEYAAMEDKTNLELSAEYERSKLKLTFYYNEKGNTQTKKPLFEIDAGNEQRERKYPTKNDEETFNEEEILYTLPPEGGKGEPYIPGKFPVGSWEIYEIKDSNTKEYGQYKILTTAWRMVDVWKSEDVINEDKKIEKKWRIKTDANGNTVQAKDGCLWIHGGRSSTATSELDAIRGSNNFMNTTLGCIRIKNIDAELIEKTIRKYLKTKRIPLEVK